MTEKPASAVIASGDPGSSPHPADLNAETELATWLSGVECFLGTAAHPFADKLNLRPHDWSPELQLSRSGLQICLEILARMNLVTQAKTGVNSLSAADRDELAAVARNAVVVADGLLRSDTLSWEQWVSWSQMVAERLQNSGAFERAVMIAEGPVDGAVPERLLALIASDRTTLSDKLDLTKVVRGFGTILLRLAIIGRMLERDEPLKPSLLIFARIQEDTLELVDQINHRLIRFANEDAELFRTLDSASYTASIELRKVFDQELAGLPTVRSAVTVFARVETAYAVLRDGVENILAGIGKMLSPEVSAVEIFPHFRAKYERSIILRNELAAMVGAVRAAEQGPDSSQIAPEKLKAFIAGPVQSLFYKDRESVERFIEEILRTRERKDLVPILHRFGAYLETLFGHVNNRTVLAEHPFEIPN